MSMGLGRDAHLLPHALLPCSCSTYACDLLRFLSCDLYGKIGDGVQGIGSVEGPVMAKPRKYPETTPRFGRTRNWRLLAHGCEPASQDGARFGLSGFCLILGVFDDLARFHCVVSLLAVVVGNLFYSLQSPSLPPAPPPLPIGPDLVVSLTQ
ncbi:hypothetical protein PENSPDRAFT_672668 [Peniophora sp. CONT]|nr:hypothetical protein PENSPDRAFT_672668 [Peniophora sp. CONT]